MNPLYLIPNDAPAVQQAIQYVVSTGMARGATILFYQSAVPSYGITFPGWMTYTTTFTRTGFPDYTAISGMLAYYPSISITEMEATGLMPKA